MAATWQPCTGGLLYNLGVVCMRAAQLRITITVCISLGILDRVFLLSTEVFFREK
jgi:hypothetical protein